MGNAVPGEPFGGFHERGSYLIQCPDPQARLYVDDAPLPVSECGAFWQWSPGFYAGPVRVELQRTPELIVQFQFVVSPDPAKASSELFSGYLSDIASHDPTLLLGAESAAYGLSASLGAFRLWVSYRRLALYGTRYLRALQEALARPIERLKDGREQRPLSRVRRVDQKTVSELMRRPSLLSGILNGADLTSPVASPIDVPASNSTLDHDANRILRSQLRHVLTLSAQVEQKMRSLRGSRDLDPELAARLPRCVERVRKIRRLGRRLLSSGSLAGVSDAPPGVAGLNAVSGHPQYGAVFVLGRRLLSQGVDSAATQEWHSLATTWQIYETWCYCVLSRVLREQYPDGRWREQVSPTGCDRKFQGTANKARVTLYFQLICPSLKASASTGYVSISRERRPDFVFEVDAGQGVRYICLDAKYKSSRTRLLEAMASAHIYRDAIRRDGEPPDAAYLVCPTITSVAALAEEAYLSAYRVGCLQLRDSADAQAVIARVLAGGLIPRQPA